MILSLLIIILLGLPGQRANATLTPFPVFLRAGFSTILEFDDSPTRVVLGDSNVFQLERLDRSLVIKALAPYATTNMFVYFKSKESRLFVLTASEEAEPTYYKRFEDPKSLPIPVQTPRPQKIGGKPHAKPQSPVSRGSQLLEAQFDDKKDYFTVEISIAADSLETIRPAWELVKLIYKNNAIAPIKLWSERKEIQKDSQVKSRFVFAKPNIPRTLQDVILVVPIHGNPNPIRLSFPVSTK